MNRKPISATAKKHLTWTTHFHDLRKPESLGNTNFFSKQTLLRESKILALFHEHSLIRDSNIVCNYHLLELLAHNTANIHSAFGDGSFVLTIRDSCESLSEVNEAVGTRRGIADTYQLAKDPLIGVDAFFSGGDFYSYSNPISPSADSFRQLVEKISMPDVFLTGAEAGVLSKAVAHADEQTQGNMLRFGDIYNYLSNVGNPSLTSNIIDYCRTAYNLVLPFVTDIPYSCADADLPFEKIMHLCPQEVPTFEDFEITPDCVPPKILTMKAIDSMDFNAITQHRLTGYKVGYFDALRHAREAIQQGSPRLARIYMTYLKTLREYITAIGSDHRLELAEWQKAVAFSGDSESVKQWKRFLVWAVPTVIDMALLYTTTLQIPVIAPSVLGVQLLIFNREYQMKKFLSGTPHIS